MGGWQIHWVGCLAGQATSGGSCRLRGAGSMGTQEGLLHDSVCK